MGRNDYELPQVIDNTSGNNPAAALAENLHNAAYEGGKLLAFGAAKNAASVIDGVGQTAADVGTTLAYKGLEEAGKEMIWRGRDSFDQFCKPRIDFDWVTPTKEETQEAKKKLDAQVSELIPDRDKALLKDMQHNLLDGNLAAFERDIKQFRGDPEKLKAFIKELDKNLKETHADISLAVSGDGNVLVYKNHGSTAVEISPNTGTKGVRPIRTTWDGTVILEPGEVLGKDPKDVMKDVGNHGVNRINDWEKPIITCWPKPVEVDPGFWPKPTEKPWWREDPISRERPWEDPGFFPRKRGGIDFNPYLMELKNRGDIMLLNDNAAVEKNRTYD